MQKKKTLQNCRKKAAECYNNHHDTDICLTYSLFSLGNKLPACIQWQEK